jgi:flagellar protein FlaJ
MEQVNKHIGELQTIDRERYAAMRPYAVVVYIAFGVFLFTDIMLIQMFFTEIVNLQTSVLQTAGGGGVFGTLGSSNIPLLKMILFHATIIQAIFGGLIAGKMSEGRLGAGLKHTVALLLITFMAFFIFVWGV